MRVKVKIAISEERYCQHIAYVKIFDILQFQFFFSTSCKHFQHPYLPAEAGLSTCDRVTRVSSRCLRRLLYNLRRYRECQREFGNDFNPVMPNGSSCTYVLVLVIKVQYCCKKLTLTLLTHKSSAL